MDEAEVHGQVAEEDRDVERARRGSRRRPPAPAGTFSPPSHVHPDAQAQEQEQSGPARGRSTRQARPLAIDEAARRASRARSTSVSAAMRGTARRMRSTAGRSTRPWPRTPRRRRGRGPDHRRGHGRRRTGRPRQRSTDRGPRAGALAAAGARRGTSRPSRAQVAALGGRASRGAVGLGLEPGLRPAAEDHLARGRLQNARDRHLDRPAQRLLALVDHHHRPVVEVGDALARFLAFLDHEDAQHLARAGPRASASSRAR